MTDILTRSIAELTRSDISPTELVQAAFAQIGRCEPQLNAFISLFHEESLRRAREIEAEMHRGENPGPLSGIPIAVKDIIHLAGTETTCGAKNAVSAVRNSAIDATVIKRLKAAGAIIIGKTNLHEHAFGVTTENPHFGVTRNPWHTAHVPGGSSGGSGAAVAARFCAGALGTDTGGSVRIPASLCGIVGLKPTFGRISVHGVVELAQSLDCIGPMCRTAQDIAILMNVLTNDVPPVSDYTADIGKPIAGMKIGLHKAHFFQNLDVEVETAVEKAMQVLEELGVEFIEVSMPSVPDAHAAALTILMAEAAHFHREQLLARREDYGADVRELLDAGLNLSALDYVTAVRARDAARREFVEAFRKVDVLLTPATPIPAPPISIGMESSNELRPRLTQETRIFNLLGLPAISVPCGFTEAGLPIGMQLAGSWWDEKRLIHIADAYQNATGWHRRLPPGP